MTTATNTESDAGVPIRDPEIPQDNVHQYPPSYPASTRIHEAEDNNEIHFRHPTYRLHSHKATPSKLEASFDGDRNIDEADTEDEAAVELRAVTRTPSPTPTEARVLSEKSRMCDWKGYYARIRNPRPHLTKRNLWILLVVSMIIAFISTFLAYQQRIVDRLQPFARWMHDTPGGWLIPIGLMFVLSFPPLFGHELIAILCGDVWGVWIGFGIVAAGTFFGELGNFYAFKWCCNARGKRYEETKIKYALYAQVVREGGLKMPTIMRFTAIPGHLLTAVFSTCGMSVWMFGASAILSLPKQLAIVYIGVSKESSGVGSDAKATGVKVAVVLVTGVMTVVAMRYIDRKMDEVKHRVVYARRKARQMKALAAAEPSLLAVDLEGPGFASDTMFSLSSTPAMDDKLAKERSADDPETNSQARTGESGPIAISAVPHAAGRDGSREGRRKLRWR